MISVLAFWQHLQKRAKQKIQTTVTRNAKSDKNQLIRNRVHIIFGVF